MKHCCIHDCAVWNPSNRLRLASKYFLPQTASPGVKYVLPRNAIYSDDKGTIFWKYEDHVRALESRQNQICMPQHDDRFFFSERSSGRQKTRVQITHLASKIQTIGSICKSFPCNGIASGVTRDQFFQQKVGRPWPLKISNYDFQPTLPALVQDRARMVRNSKHHIQIHLLPLAAENIETSLTLAPTINITVLPCY